jgi:hypothetical protein
MSKDEFVLGYQAFEKSVRRGDVDVTEESIDFLFRNGYGKNVLWCLYQVYVKYINIANLGLADDIVVLGTKIEDVPEKESVKDVAVKMAESDKTYAVMASWNSAQVTSVPVVGSYAEACDSMFENKLIPQFLNTMCHFGFTSNQQFYIYIKSKIDDNIWKFGVVAKNFIKDFYDVPFMALAMLKPKIVDSFLVKDKPEIVRIKGFPAYAINSMSKYGTTIRQMLVDNFAGDEKIIDKYMDIFEGFPSPVAVFDYPYELVGNTITKEERLAYAGLVDQVYFFRKYCMENYYKEKIFIEKGEQKSVTQP